MFRGRLGWQVLFVRNSPCLFRTELPSVSGEVRLADTFCVLLSMEGRKRRRRGGAILRHRRFMFYEVAFSCEARPIDTYSILTRSIVFELRAEEVARITEHRREF